MAAVLEVPFHLDAFDMMLFARHLNQLRPLYIHFHSNESYFIWYKSFRYTMMAHIHKAPYSGIERENHVDLVLGLKFSYFRINEALLFNEIRIVCSSIDILWALWQWPIQKCEFQVNIYFHKTLMPCSYMLCIENDRKEIIFGGGITITIMSFRYIIHFVWSRQRNSFS